MPVTYTFSAGGTVNAADLNTNFTDVLNELSGLTVADLHAASGILSTNLADRFETVRETIELSPRSIRAAGAWAALNLTLPGAAPSATYELWRVYFTNRTGKMAYLVDVSIHAIDTTPGAATAYAAVSVTRSGTQLGGGVAQIRAANTRYRLANANPFDNPLTSLADGDYLSVQVGTDPVLSALTVWSGVTITFTYKIELGG